MEPSLTDITKTSDGDLVAMVVQGDSRAFELLFERHRQRVAAIAGRFFQQVSQIEEVVQKLSSRLISDSQVFPIQSQFFRTLVSADSVQQLLRRTRKQSRSREQSQ